MVLEEKGVFCTSWLVSMVIEQGQIFELRQHDTGKMWIYFINDGNNASVTLHSIFKSKRSIPFYFVS